MKKPQLLLLLIIHCFVIALSPAFSDIIQIPLSNHANGIINIIQTDFSDHTSKKKPTVAIFGTIGEQHQQESMSVTADAGTASLHSSAIQQAQGIENYRHADLLQQQEEKKERTVDSLYETYIQAGKDGDFTSEQNASNELKKYGIDALALKKARERKQAVIFLQEISRQYTRGNWENIDLFINLLETISMDRYEILSSDTMFDNWYIADNKARENMVVQLMKRVLLKEEDWNIDNARFKNDMSNRYGVESFDQALDAFMHDLQKDAADCYLYRQAAKQMSSFVFKAKGDVSKGIDSMPPELRMKAKQILAANPWLSMQYQKAYQISENIKKNLKNFRPDFPPIADQLLSLGTDSPTFRLALDFVAQSFPKDKRTWLYQAVEDRVYDMGKWAQIVTIHGANEKKAFKLTHTLQELWKGKRNLPTTWLGKAIHYLASHIPLIVAIVVIAFGVHHLPSGSKTQNILKVVFGFLILITYGAGDGVDAYSTGSNQVGAMIYSISIGSVRLCLDFLGFFCIFLTLGVIQAARKDRKTELRSK